MNQIQKITDDPNISDKLKRIKLLAMDVDGVLTNGRIIYNDKGEETQIFNAKDGFGIRLLILSGIKVCIITGRQSRAVHHRCADLGITDIFDGVSDKASILQLIQRKNGFSNEEVAFIGDDLPDLPLLRLVGLSIAVADAHQTVLERADMVTSTGGGMGAVREICEMILKAKEIYNEAIERFL